jgi:hypothetical protein
MRELSFTISMDYPGWSISKNGLWNGGNRRWGMNKEAKRWKGDLAEAVKLALIEEGVGEPKPPVHVLVTGRFIDRGSAPDLHNLGETICDSVQDGSGIDDKHFTFQTAAPTFERAVPEILVTVTLHANLSVNVAR